LNQKAGEQKKIRKTTFRKSVLSCGRGKQSVVGRIRVKSEV